ncbi:hypothetical protein PSR1_01218 [Anaeromyxobacter sp. PSR-1]|nr:hypothetical protein PSR1_01218 [Anaeromyxobacter sp. PSR-1]
MIVPSAFTAAVPFPGAVAMVTVAGGSCTVSLASTFTVAAASSSVVTASSTATGEPLSTAVTATLTVAEPVWPSESVTW